MDVSIIWTAASWAAASDPARPPLRELEAVPLSLPYDRLVLKLVTGGQRGRIPGRRHGPYPLSGAMQTRWLSRLRSHNKSLGGLMGSLRRWLNVLVLAAFTLGLTQTVIAQQGDSNPKGLWVGWHECGGVKVGTAALIDVDSAGLITGIRQFYPTRNDSSRPVGSFRISGSFRRDTGAVSLTAGEWITQPPGYNKCNFVGRIDATGRRITGNSPGCSCGTFELQRQ